MVDPRDNIKTDESRLLTVSLNRFQLIYEKVLLWATLILCIYHMAICMVRYIVEDRSIYENYDRWFGLVLLGAIIVYFFITIRFFPRNIARLKTISLEARSYEHRFLFFLFFWYILSCAMRQFYIGTHAFKDNDWWLYITGLTSFVMFPLASFAGANRAKKLIDPMLLVILIPHMIFFAWVIWQYFHMNYVTFPSGTILEMNRENGIGLAIGENRNITGMSSLTLLCLCWYMVFTQKSFKKIPFAFGVLIYLTTMILSNCRTAWYASLIMFAMLAFLLSWYGLKDKGKWIVFASGLLSAVLCVMAVHWFRTELFHYLDQAVHFSEPVTTSAHTNAEAVLLSSRLFQSQQVAGASVSPLGASSDYVRTFQSGLSGREPVYRASFAVMSDRIYNFLFGVTHADVGKSLYGRCGVNRVFPSAHNYFLQMGVAFGVPVMVASMIFIGSLLLRCFRIVFRHKEQLFPGAWMVPVVVITQLAGEITETWITAGSSIVCNTFYLFAGWVVAMDIELQRKAKSREELGVLPLTGKFPASTE